MCVFRADLFIAFASVKCLIKEIYISLDHVDIIKDLGVLVDEELSFEMHIRENIMPNLMRNFEANPVFFL